MLVHMMWFVSTQVEHANGNYDGKLGYGGQ